MNILFGMIAIDVLYGTEVIFNCLSHSQARPDVLLYSFSVRLKYSIGYGNCSLKVLKLYCDVLCAYINCDKS